MKRSALILVVLLVACSHAPRQGSDRAAVESRSVPAKAGIQARASQKARATESESDSADPQQVIERQSRRIAELESRAATDAEARQVLELVSYSQRVAGMKPDEQTRELAAANQEFGRDPQPYSRVRLALLLATPGTSFTDETRAVSLLDPLVSGSGKGPVKQFASLVHAQISERLREQKRVAQLKEQIDGLRAIDRSLIERDQGRTP